KFIRWLTYLAPGSYNKSRWEKVKEKLGVAHYLIFYFSGIIPAILCLRVICLSGPWLYFAVKFRKEVDTPRELIRYANYRLREYIAG
ncbi:MAG: hypothetical protein ACXWPM_05270, partial [Bdellovibrionota bacterium]